MKEDEINGACSTDGRGKKCQNISLEDLKVRAYLENQGGDMRIILKLISKIRM
jgi:hypothetical protein